MQTHTVERTIIFGEVSRWKLTQATNRFGEREWFIADGELLNTDGLPIVIVQTSDCDELGEWIKYLN